MARMESRGVYRVLAKKPEGKRPLGRHRRKWEEILELILKKLVERSWIGLGWLI